MERDNEVAYSASKGTNESMNKKELEKYIATRPSAKESDGAWKRLQDQQKQLDRLEKLGRENSQHKAPIINYIEKTRADYNDPILEDRGKQTVAINHTANKYLNNQVNKGNI